MTRVNAAEQAGQRFRMGWVAELVSERGLALLGPSSDGSVAVGTTPLVFDAVDPAARAYRQEQDRYQPGRHYDGYSTWGAIDVLATAMRSIDGEVTPGSTLSALRSFKADTKVWGRVDFTKERANPAYRRLFTTNASVYRILNGRPLHVDPIDLTSLFDAA